MTLATEIGYLASRIRGKLIQTDDPEYEGARKVFNGMIDRHPRVIVRCSDVADVISCVNFARSEDLPLSIRAGGHNVAGFATNDDGLVIDLSPMKGIRVDPERRTARVQAGCTWGDLDHATHAFGLAAPGGVVSTTGVAGLTLGGGIGHLTRPFGLACDNLISADVVTAEGQLIVAGETENADLFWALRGGGGNFGVVTSFEFRLHPVSTVYAGPIFWPLDQAAEVMKFYGDFITSAPEQLNGIFAFTVLPAAEPFPPNLHNRSVCGAMLNYVGPSDKGEAVTRPLAEFGTPDLVGLGPMPFPVLQTVFDAVSPPGHPNYWKADFVAGLHDDLIQAHAQYGPHVPNPLSGAITFSVDGAAQRLSQDATAWSYRDASFSHVIYAVDEDPAAMPRHIEWVRDYWDALHPHSAGGAYVNFLMEEGEDRVAASYRGNYTRLKQVKRKYDPNNLFRLNQNIAP